MDVMAWTALLEINGMGAIHEAAARIRGSAQVVTLDDRAYICEHYPFEKAQTIADRLNIPLSRVKNIARAEGITKSPEVLKAQRIEVGRKVGLSRAKLSSAERVANMMASVKGER